MNKVKQIIVISSLLTGYLAYPQFEVAIGVAKFDSDRNSIGMAATCSFNKIYFDVTSNFASGEGEQLNFQSSSTYKIDKLSISVFNFGYNFYPIDEIGVTPYLGWGSTREIYQDPISFDSWFYANQRSFLNVGVLVKYYFDENYGLLLGVGNYEKLKVALAVRLL